MYKNRNMRKSFEDNNSEDDFDFCNTETGQKFAIKWSPSDEIKFISKHRFIGTRPLSRSVPRRKRSLFQYQINRSLNFEIGTPRRETIFKSPSFASDESPVCKEKYLTRSARILRSLNINFSPSRAKNKRINKTLNFDLSPSPKRIFGSSDSLCRKESPGLESNINKMSKINKTLNFSSSSNASNFSSYLGSSVDSIDENQNRTPSHRNKNVKKSLNYLTPSPKPNANISRPVNKTPISREEFINNLKYNAETPEFRDIKQSEKKSKHFDGISVSTPRNLFQDFEDEDKEMRPATPDNVVQFVPESMSAIKKSHKKVRHSYRAEKVYANQLREYCNQTENSSEDPIMLSQSEERPATPITNDSYPSPNYSISSIKQSHKKDKSKKKSVAIHSEDEISDSGSIFDYTELMESKQDPEYQLHSNSSPLSITSSSFGVFQNADGKRSICLDSSVEPFSDQGSMLDCPETVGIGSVATLKSSPSKMDVHDHSGLQYQAKDKEPLKLSFDKLELISPVKAEMSGASGVVSNCDANEGRPVTPENVVNVLDQVMSDSIKKSHKKVKDRNKKTLLKPQVSMQISTTELPPSNNSQEGDDEGLNENSNHQTPENLTRASTPENVNSSRLLLGQYSSVKKSHKKNKHKKIVTESAKRQKYFNGDDQLQNSNDFCHVSGVKTLSPCSLGTSNETQLLVPATGIETCSETPDKRSIEFSRADKSPLERSTPNKRKKSFSLIETTSSSSIDLSNIESSSMDYESAEEEFKIFTPIKKRRSLHAPDDIEEIKTADSEIETSQALKSTDKNCVTQEESFKSIENTCITPPPNRCSDHVAGQRVKTGDTNGRSTPQNRSTSEMIFDINSIKKSHKKDKRSSRLRRTLNTDDDKNDFHAIKVAGVIEENKTSTSYQIVTPNSSISENHLENPQPSTSSNGTNTQATKTPPNCSRVTNYLKLRQADSIKRSHKKTREQKKRIVSPDDPDLSDDGSIFDNSDRIASNEVEDNTAVQLLPQTPPNRSKLLIQIESIKKSHKKVREFKRQGGREVGADMSDDGSIFDPGERLNGSLNDIEKLESSRESSPTK